MTDEKRRLDRNRMRDLMEACIAIEVRLFSGDLSIGTGFHVGEGVFLTARHVLEGNTIIKLLESSTERAAVDGNGRKTLTLSAGPFYHSDPDVDVAAFKLAGPGPELPIFELGGHYDDWVNDADWVLTEAIVFGYPPIPMALDAILVVDQVIVNAVVDTYRDRYMRFVVSGVPRGGFSGGPVFHEWGFVLGMITESLERQDDPFMSGYLTVLSIESSRECLEQHDLLPECQRLE